MYKATTEVKDKENKFKKVWCELESKAVFQIQSVTKY